MDSWCPIFFTIPSTCVILFSSLHTQKLQKVKDNGCLFNTLSPSAYQIMFDIEQMLSEESMELLIPASWVWITSWVQLCFPDGSDGKESACNTETQVWSLGQEDPLKKGLATHSRILAWRFSWTEEPGRFAKSQTQMSNHHKYPIHIYWTNE